MISPPPPPLAPRSRLIRIVFVMLASLIGVAPQAAVTRLVIESRESPAFDGRTFGDIGAYEHISGRIVGEVDPADRRNALITDIALAPRNARGRVEYETTFTLLRPLKPARASGLLVYSVPNRGNRNLADTLNVGGDPGDGFIYRRGDAILFSGWQGDLAPRRGLETITVPVARHADGSAITGPVLARFRDFGPGARTLLLPSRRPPASLDPSRATLTKRAAEDGAIIPIAASEWAFADCRFVPFPGTPSNLAISLRGGFDPALLYELSYTAKDPPVLGLGLAATRDVVSFFRRETRDAAGTPNPLDGRVRHVVAQGVSQSGNFTKTFLHLGFNEDEAGRRVWDGVNVHIAGRQAPLNFRFAAPGGAASLYEPGSEGVLWWHAWPDTARGRPTPASLLDRARAAGVVPRIFETFGSAELWSLRMSPGLVGTAAAADIPLPPELRRYYFPGTSHGGAGGGFDTTPASALNRFGLAGNPNPQRETLRALYLALIDWVAKDAEPPASTYPRLDRGELVPPEARAMGFPRIPGAPLPDQLINPLLDYDFGPEFDHANLSGIITRQPPHIQRILPSLVPRVDADGNELGGIPSVLHQAPLGSYLGWSVVAEGFYRDRAAGFGAAFIPFKTTRAERLAAGDPRPSLEERYATHHGYVNAVRQAAARSLAAGFLLPEDAARLIAEAEAGNVLRALR